MQHIKELFDTPILFEGNLIIRQSSKSTEADNHDQTKEIFTDKWKDAENYKDLENLYQFQYEWFFSLFGFKDEEDVRVFLSDKKYIIDAGCGLGYKAAWLAELAPHATVIGIDISESVYFASRSFKHLPNLYYMQGDIAHTNLKSNSIDFVLCDQVIMHTENPEKTFAHLSDITSKGGSFACYVYRKKALPRELVDDYFRTQTHNIPNDKMWEFAEQLTVLGKVLSDLKVNFECPDLPVLGIKGGTYDIQRFIYWNFLKCFWKEDWSFDLNKATNYDWYAPSNAKRYSKQEFESMILGNHLTIEYFHEEEACYSGRFLK
jgi:SAM-dependent methyltransferase